MLVNRLTHLKTLHHVLRVLNASGLTNLSKSVYILTEPDFLLVVNVLTSGSHWVAWKENSWRAAFL